MDERLVKILGGEGKFYPYGLESTYPRIFARIMALWNKPGMEDYFLELMVQEREERAGFPPEIAAEIVRLSLVHASQNASNKKHDIWEVSADKFANFKPPVSIENVNAWKPLPLLTKQEIEKLGIPCTPKGFHAAVETGVRRVVSIFLEARVNTEIYNERGWTPLMLAAFNGHDEILSLLIKHKANLFASDLLGNTALHWAADAGQTSSAKLLIENRATVDAGNNAGCTPLSLAAAKRHLGVVLMLIDSGAKPNAAARDGSTALHKATAAGYTEITRALLHHGADASLKNLAGETPLTLAAKNDHHAVLKILMPGSNAGNPA